QVDRTPNDMIMDMGFVDMGTDHKGMIALCEPLGKFNTQPVGFLRGDLAGFERLAHMVSDHIVCTAHSPGGGDILSLCQHELGVGHTAVAGEASDEFAAVCLLWICHIVDDVADGAAF